MQQTKPTPEQQSILNRLRAGFVLTSSLSTKYRPFNGPAEHGGFIYHPNQEARYMKPVLISTIKAMLAKGLIVEEKRFSSEGFCGGYETQTWRISYTLPEKKQEEEQRERRRLFIRAMRQPEMRLLYQALWHLKWDKGVAISDIQIIDMERYGFHNDCWLLLTDKWLVTTLQANKPDLGIDDFLSFRLHDDTDPFCDCSECREALMCHLSCKSYYVALMEREAEVSHAK